MKFNKKAIGERTPITYQKSQILKGKVIIIFKRKKYEIREHDMLSHSIMHPNGCHRTHCADTLVEHVKQIFIFQQTKQTELHNRTQCTRTE